MPLPFPRSAGQRRALAIVLTIIAAAFLIGLLKVVGLIVALLLAGAVWVMLSMRPDAHEHRVLRSSIQLSAEDITDVMDEFDHFSNAQDADTIADRTLHRPALLDYDCGDEAVERFHYQYASARRFLNRLNARLASTELETQDLESLLRVTDQRALDIKESWINARRSAQRLGTRYNGEGPDNRLGGEAS
ncbi:hypothetical protein ACEE23_05915 [Corynebacterium sp. 32222D000AT]|uniref:hypothetical protein n=1 Tax=unclassified Corynebacterium TaxID=2624378 RepID=UPI002A941EB2|nr:hypothetical protein [Mycobacteriaceae bacterium]MDY5828564.1 hypothetical protein [Corynebacterium sp.]